MSNEKRMQQIRDAARYKYPDERIHFIDGAKWADQHPQWIPVEESLPPIAYHDDLSENYLVVDSDGELLIAYYDAKNELWFSVDSNPKIYDVTHWMQIVPPRKEE